MLKIEKNEQVEIKLVSRETFFNQNLKLALLLALCFHLIAFVIVKVKPLGSDISDLILPPVMVKAEMEIPSTHVHSSYDNDGPSRRHIPPPPLPKPEVCGPEKVDLYHYIEPFDISKQFALPLPEFDEDVRVDTSSYPIYDHRIVVRISGPAGELKWRNELITQSFLDKLPEGAHHLNYEIRVSGETGEIVWLHGDQSTIGHELIKKIELEPSPQHWIVPGNIEIYTYHVRR